jgi:hypothetical protein
MKTPIRHQDSRTLLLLRIRVSGTNLRPDQFAGDDDFDAPVLLTAYWRVIAHDGI